MKLHPVILFRKVTTTIFAVLAPLGVWGLGGIAFIDSAFIPMPVPLDGIVFGYAAQNHSKFLLYCFMAALCSALGSLVPYYIGRAGGELFLLKRIDRKRYEQLRDRFERQEFLAIMIPALLPPPTPIKLFEIAAGVFEMRPLAFTLAIFIGKFLQFLVCALLAIFFGPTILRTLTELLHEHVGYILGIGGIIVVLLIVWVVRKLFDRPKGTRFPVEETSSDLPDPDLVPEE